MRTTVIETIVKYKFFLKCKLQSNQNEWPAAHVCNWVPRGEPGEAAGVQVGDSFSADAIHILASDCLILTLI